MLDLKKAISIYNKEVIDMTQLELKNTTSVMETNKDEIKASIKDGVEKLESNINEVKASVDYRETKMQKWFILLGIVSGAILIINIYLINSTIGELNCK